MATLAQLASKGVHLECIEVELDEGLPHRFLYGTPQFLTWLSDTLPAMETGRMQADLTPQEQVYARFREYIVGDNLGGDRRFAPLICHPDTYVWELKTIDVRIFGWVPKMDHFVCCFGASADWVKDRSLYSGYMSQVKYVRDRLDLDPPKSIEFREYENVLSDARRR